MSEGTLREICEPGVKIQDDNILPEPSDEFVATPYIQGIAERAFLYLTVGYPVHLAGPAGTGKTTLAFHLASQLGRPVMLIHGDDEFRSSDLVGRDNGYQKYKLVDNYIHSVVKTEEHMNSVWVDNRLTTACQNGYTLVYDEFTRSRPEANNVLLSVLEEKVLTLPKVRGSGEGYLRVHSDFHAIFTSNPEEYAGTHKTQDALMDRLITLNMGSFDRDSEIMITMAHSGLERRDAEVIVDIVRGLRAIGVNTHRPTIRACIAIGRILAYKGGHAQINDDVFVKLCHDVLNINTAKVSHEGQSLMPQKVDEIICKICGGERESKNKKPGTRKRRDRSRTEE